MLTVWNCAEKSIINFSHGRQICTDKKRDILDLYRAIINGKLSLNEGMLYENAIAQMLTALGKKLFFYTQYNAQKHRNDIEIDFLLSNESKTNFKIIPVEVKSAKNYTALSLTAFKAKFGKKIEREIIIHPKNLVREDGLLRIPPYMIWCME